MVDILVASTWRLDTKRALHRAGGARPMADTERVEEERFAWRQGRAEVAVHRDGDQWKVVYSTSGRLFGPRQVLYEQRHRYIKHAAWDVMARVIRVSQDEDEGVRVAKSAARWMTELGLSPATPQCPSFQKSKPAAGSSSTSWSAGG